MPRNEIPSIWASGSAVHVGPLSPIGGISVYLNRLRRLYPDLRVVDEVRLSSVGFLAMAADPKTQVVYHTPNFRRQLALGLVSQALRKRYSFCLHGDDLFERYRAGKSAKRALIAWLFKGAHAIQTVNPATARFLTDELEVQAERVRIEDSFLPPPAEDEARILAGYPPEILRFAQRRPFIVANAHRLRFFKGIDLYGLDMCIELVSRLLEDFADVGLLCALGAERDGPYFRRLLARIRELGIERHVVFLCGHELWPLTKRATVMVRPTCTDGFGISVAEALYFGVPAIASDVCRRPEGTILFRSRDLDDFVSKTRGAVMRSPEMALKD